MSNICLFKESRKSKAVTNLQTCIINKRNKALKKNLQPVG